MCATWFDNSTCLLLLVTGQWRSSTLRLSGSSSGSNGSVRTIGALSEVWVGRRRDVDSGSDWGEDLRTKDRDPVLRWI
jgi:hypothetical protein